MKPVDLRPGASSDRNIAGTLVVDTLVLLVLPPAVANVPRRGRLAVPVVRARDVDATGGDLNRRVLPDVALRPVTFEDWAAIHLWASTEEACRYQPWGPNTAEQTQAFAREAVSAWRQDPRYRYVCC
jgi:RimJ/RimL family protein N-acetyltransferase